MNLFSTICHSASNHLLLLSWDTVHCGLGMSFPFISDLIVLIALFWIVFSIHVSLLPVVLFLTETLLRKPF